MTWLSIAACDKERQLVTVRVYPVGTERHPVRWMRVSNSEVMYSINTSIVSGTGMTPGEHGHFRALLESGPMKNRPRTVNDVDDLDDRKSAEFHDHEPCVVGRPS